MKKSNSINTSRTIPQSEWHTVIICNPSHGIIIVQSPSEKIGEILSTLIKQSGIVSMETAGRSGRLLLLKNTGIRQRKSISTRLFQVMNTLTGILYYYRGVYGIDYSQYSDDQMSKLSGVREMCQAIAQSMLLREVLIMGSTARRVFGKGEHKRVTT
jgi:hypothetical protein